jgi:uncharacterized protein YbdZ (MbtH family)
MKPAATPAFYRVVINHEGCYCIWPNDAVVPSGWRPIGFSSTAEVALNQVAELWRQKAGQPGERTGGEADSGDQ